MKQMKKRWRMLVPTVLLLALAFSTTVFAAEEEVEYVPALHATFWALVPAIVAIGLALVTKEVYSSLFVGILMGAILYSGFQFELTITHIFSDGIIGVLSDSYNVGILVFLVILGAMVSLMNKAGGSAAFGQFAASKIKNRVGAQLATILLGVLIFIDDYFNCLTVGSVMRPVTDKFKVSRSKLAYLIDATAAPVCIIAPISSWAAAVTGFVEGEDGFSIFIRAIPYNFYAILTIVMMVGMVLMKTEFGKMKEHEKNAARKGDLFTTEGRPYENVKEEKVSAKGGVVDLLIPIAALIVCCVIGMIYTGGFFEGAGFVEAFSNSDASLGLTLGSFFGLIITIVLYQIRRVLSFKECMDCIPGDGACDFESDFCVDAQGDDGQSGRGSVCGRAGGVQRGRVYELPACDYLCGGVFPRFCDGHFLGNLRYSDSDRGGGVPEWRSADDDYVHFRLHGRCGVRRPLFAHFRYDHHGFRGGTVRACEPCDDPASLCSIGGGGVLCHLHCGRFCEECVDCAPRGRCADAGGAVCAPQYQWCG